MGNVLADRLDGLWLGRDSQKSLAQSSQAVDVEVCPTLPLFAPFFHHPIILTSHDFYDLVLI